MTIEISTRLRLVLRADAPVDERLSWVAELDGREIGNLALVQSKQQRPSACEIECHIRPDKKPFRDATAALMRHAVTFGYRYVLAVATGPAQRAGYEGAGLQPIAAIPADYDGPDGATIMVWRPA
jgi:hypothetical protein